MLAACGSKDEGPGRRPDTSTSDVTGTGTGAVGTGCAPDPALSVAVDVAPGPLANAWAVTATASAPTRLALVCAADDDMGDAHVMETVDAVSEHTFHVLGLRPGSASTCMVVGTCPAQVGASEPFALRAGHAPDRVPEVRVDGGGARDGYLLAALSWEGGCASDTQLVLYDVDGWPRWWHTLADTTVDIEALPVRSGAAELFWGGGGRVTGAPARLSLWDGPVWEAALPGGHVGHHDAKELDDGRVLTLEAREDRQGGATWTGFAVRIGDPQTGAVDWEWRSQQAVDAGVLRPGGGPWNDDPYHATWAEHRVLPSGAERVYVSLCYDYRVLSIDVATGQVVWQLARDGDLTAVSRGGRELDALGYPSCQHGLEVDATGERLLVYDNGLGRSESRALEYRIDEARRVAVAAWDWSEPGWYTAMYGDVDWLEGGDVLVTRSHAACVVPHGAGPSQVLEVTRASGDVPWSMTFADDEVAVGRSERIEGCRLLSSTRHCPTLASRRTELQASWDVP